MKKYIKPLIILSALGIVVVGCSEKENTDINVANDPMDNPPIEEVVHIEPFDYTMYEKLNDDDVLVKVNGNEFMFASVKEQVKNPQELIQKIMEFEEKIILGGLYQIDEDLVNEQYNQIKTEQEKMIEELPEDAPIPFPEITKSEIELQYLREKAITDGVTVTEEDLKKLYDEQFKEYDTRTFEEMRDELEEMAAFHFGNDIMEIIKEERKKLEISYLNENLENELKRHFGIME